MEQTGTQDLGGTAPPATGPGGIREQAAEKLESAAEALHERAQDYEGRLGGYGRQAADWLDRSARYVREADVNRLKGHVEERVRLNPGRALLVAGAAGLILGTLLRRR